jgi:hypothetical protein
MISGYGRSRSDRCPCTKANEDNLAQPQFYPLGHGTVHAGKLDPHRHHYVAVAARLVRSGAQLPGGLLVS